MAVLFDLSDEIQLIDQAPDNYGVEVEDFFYAIRMCGMIAVIIPVFEVERTEKGCVITAYGKICSPLDRNSRRQYLAQLAADRGQSADRLRTLLRWLLSPARKLGGRRQARLQPREGHPPDGRLRRKAAERVGRIPSHPQGQVGLLDLWQ